MWGQEGLRAGSPHPPPAVGGQLSVPASKPRRSTPPPSPAVAPGTAPEGPVQQRLLCAQRWAGPGLHLTLRAIRCEGAWAGHPRRCREPEPGGAFKREAAPGGHRAPGTKRQAPSAKHIKHLTRHLARGTALETAPDTRPVSVLAPSLSVRPSHLLQQDALFPGARRPLSALLLPGQLVRSVPTHVCEACGLCLGGYKRGSSDP